MHVNMLGTCTLVPVLAGGSEPLSGFPLVLEETMGVPSSAAFRTFGKPERKAVGNDQARSKFLTQAEQPPF